jgi:enoyl-CoA hydratase
MSSKVLEALDVTIDQGIAEVVLKGPGKGNAMGPEVFRELPVVFGELDRDPEVRAVLVRGSGDHFSFGLDLKSMMAQIGRFVMGPQMAARRSDLLDLIRELQGSTDAVERCRKPVIAAIAGWCIGGGLDLAAVCDVRICSADARFSLREVKLAIVADLGSLQRLPQIIGEGNTRELAFTGKDIDAARALSMHLVNAVLPDRETLLDAARAMAREIAGNPPLTVQGIKQVMSFSASRRTDDGLRFVAAWNAAFLQSLDLNEAVAAFMEKREPRFKGQ